MMLAMVILAVLALLIFCYLSSGGIRECRFLDVAVFLLLCSLCVPDQIPLCIGFTDGILPPEASFPFTPLC